MRGVNHQIMGGLVSYSIALLTLYIYVVMISHVSLDFQIFHIFGMPDGPVLLAVSGMCWDGGRMQEPTLGM